MTLGLVQFDVKEHVVTLIIVLAKEDLLLDLDLLGLILDQTMVDPVDALVLWIFLHSGIVHHPIWTQLSFMDCPALVKLSPPHGVGSKDSWAKPSRPYV